MRAELKRTRRLGCALAAAVLASACAPSSAPPTACVEPLFGLPGPATGLDSSQCGPRCGCGDAGGFTARAWTQAQLAALTTWALEVPPAEVRSDPYAQPVDAGAPGEVCAVVVTDAGARRYLLQTFPSEAAAASSQALLTHHGACGACSSLEDLSVYAKDPDLGAPVRQCGLDTFNQGFAANVECLRRLGFTLPCAQTWAWNTAHTRTRCLAPCLGLPADAGYHLRDGGLNACLQCDEELSGPVFKAVAGRTRRNTGIATAICRPCAQTRAVAHAYVDL